MPEFLRQAWLPGPAVEPADILARLLVALVLGGVVAWIYRRTRKPTEVAPSFPVTMKLTLKTIILQTVILLGFLSASAGLLAQAPAVQQQRDGPFPAIDRTFSPPQAAPVLANHQPAVPAVLALAVLAVLAVLAG
jgi:hypothetical protein